MKTRVAKLMLAAFAATLLCVNCKLDESPL